MQQYRQHLPWLLAGCVALLAGCAHLPHIAHEPTYHNPFPQLSRVAVAPFFNLSADSSVDGRQFALAYYNELQLVPGFEVVPVGVVERKMQEYRLSLGSSRDARKLAQLLEVDAVVVGVVTDFSSYYPPRCGMRVQWYAANPCYHPIPAGYGLPWGTPQAEEIPESLFFEASMAAARQQLAAQTPQPPPAALLMPPPPAMPGLPAMPAPGSEQLPPPAPLVQPMSHQLEAAGATANIGAASTTGTNSANSQPGILTPLSPMVESDAPVLRHTRVYNGNDLQFTAKLNDYLWFRDEARFGGVDGYLQRSDDFIRFCCYLHIAEMLTARGGAGETRVVWRWPSCR